MNVFQELLKLTGGSTSCGWMRDEVAEFVGGIIRFYRPELVIQTGHLWGKSSLAVLGAFAQSQPLDGNGPGGDAVFSAFADARKPQPRRQKLISIDPEPMGVPNWREGLEWLLARYGDAFEFRQQTSRDFFATFTTSERVIGIIDGDHTDEGCRRDIESLAALKAEVIIVDDTLWLPTLQGVAKRAAIEHGYGFAHHAIYNGIAVLTK